MEKEFSKNGIVVLHKDEYDDLVNHNAFIMTEYNDCYCYYYTCDYEVWHYYDSIYGGKYKNDDTVPHLADFIEEHICVNIGRCRDTKEMMERFPLDYSNKKNWRFLEIDFNTDGDTFEKQVDDAISNTEYWTKDEVATLSCDGIATFTWEQYLEAADHNGCSTFSKEFKSEDGEDIVLIQYATPNHIDDFDDTWTLEWDSRRSTEYNLARRRGE